MSNSTYFEQAIANIKLPTSLSWFNVGGKLIFPVYVNGLPTLSMAAVIYSPSKQIQIIVAPTDGALAISNKINAAIAALEA